MKWTATGDRRQVEDRRGALTGRLVRVAKGAGTLIDAALSEPADKAVRQIGKGARAIEQKVMRLPPLPPSPPLTHDEPMRKLSQPRALRGGRR